MRVDDVVTRLVDCGIAEKEARAFAHLTRLGQSKVTDLARAAGLKRAETYQILERLMTRGFVEGTLGRPRLFTAAPPESVVAHLVEEREKQLRAVESMGEDLKTRLARLSAGAAPTAPTEGFSILHDRNPIVGQLTRTLRAAKKEVCAVASSRSLFHLLLDEGLEAEFREAAKRGAKVRILTEILPGAEPVLERLVKFAEVRHAMVPRPLRFFIGDEREILQYVTADPMGSNTKETALWIGARDHVQATRGFFDEMWVVAMEADARLEELRSGRALEQVQVVKGRFTRYEKEKEMLLRAKRDVRAILSAGEVARLDGSGLGRALKAALRAGAKVRLVVPEGARVSFPGAEVRVGPTIGGLPLLLVDGVEAILVFPGKGAGEDDVTALNEYGVWVTLAPSVAALEDRFEERWAAGRPVSGEKER